VGDQIKVDCKSTTVSLQLVRNLVDPVAALRSETGSRQAGGLLEVNRDDNTGAGYPVARGSLASYTASCTASRNLQGMDELNKSLSNFLS
jgi:hypothetical protein